MNADSYLKAYSSNGRLCIEMRGVKRAIAYPRSGQLPLGGAITVEDPAFSDWLQRYQEYARDYGARKARKLDGYVPNKEPKVLTFPISEYEDQEHMTQQIAGDWFVAGISNASKTPDMFCKVVTV